MSVRDLVSLIPVSSVIDQLIFFFCGKVSWYEKMMSKYHKNQYLIVLNEYVTKTPKETECQCH